MWLLAALDWIWDDVIKPENHSLPFVFVSEFLVFPLSCPKGKFHNSSSY